MNTPTTSYPSRSSSAAATELSTPPLIATTTFLRTALMSALFYVGATPASPSAVGRRRRRPYNRGMAKQLLLAVITLSLIPPAPSHKYHPPVQRPTRDRAPMKTHTTPHPLPDGTPTSYLY